ncbi:MAG: transaldolase family protein [Clostridium sp.]
MKYLIDTANINEIEEALSLGIKGVTANPSMYVKENVHFFDFLKTINDLNPEILTAEVMGENLEEILATCDKILSINKDIIIKINFSKFGLKLINILHKKGIKTACTLIFNVNQASLAINAGADYIFPFIGRNDENGYDGVKTLSAICEFIRLNNYETKVVAASIKNVYHLEQAVLCGCDYCAITSDTFDKALHHNLTVAGAKTFESDWTKVAL